MLDVNSREHPIFWDYSLRVSLSLSHAQLAFKAAPSPLLIFDLSEDRPDISKLCKSGLIKNRDVTSTKTEEDRYRWQSVCRYVPCSYVPPTCPDIVEGVDHALERAGRPRLRFYI